MTTGRRPTLPPDELADTLDGDIATPAHDADPLEHRRVALGSHPLPSRGELDAAYFDREGDPRLKDHDDRIAALERGARVKSRRRTWTERILAFLAGGASAVLAWALSIAEQKGDARATAREREEERVWMRDSIRSLLDHDAKREGQIELLQERLRYYPVRGPTPDPQGTP